MLRLSNTPTLTHRSRAALPKPSRKVVRVSCAIHDPYTTLGVPASSDEQAVKRAFRKQALRYHPDVSKEKGAEVKFLKLAEAYGFIMRHLKGGDMPDHFDAPSSQEGSWDFHDWYWQFRINRSWSKQAKKPYADGESAEEETAQQHVAFEPGFSSPEGKQHVNSQLAGLRQRAAARKCRVSESGSDSENAAPEMQPQPQHSSQSSKPSSSSAPASNVSKHSQENTHAQPSTSHSSPTVHVPPTSPYQDLTWSALHSFSEASSTSSADLDSTASFEDLWGGQGQEHEAFNKSHTPGPRESADHASHEEASADPAHDASHAFSIGAYDGADECAAAGASSGHGYARGHFTRSPSFAATQDRKEAVMHQLAGLKRKSAFARQH